MPTPSDAHDDRTLVDRTLDRIKNDRVAAALIVAALALTALAGLGDTVRRLGDLVPARRASIDGVWTSRPVPGMYPSGDKVFVLTLRELAGGRLAGAIEIRELDASRVFAPTGFQDAQRRGDAVEARWTGNVWRYPVSGGPTVAVPEWIAGRLAGDSLAGVYQRDGHPPIGFVAYRTRPAGTE